MRDDALAFWLREPGAGEIRPARCPSRGRTTSWCATLHSGVSRGTETLVFRGGVPPSQYAAMRAPFQEGDFPGPVKYGYLNVGVVEQGPPELRGRTVFCLYPHQTAYVVPAGAVTVVPDDVPPARAVLAGTVETAVNALWDAAPLLGDRVAVVGAGMVGCCVARLLAGSRRCEVTLVDVDAGRGRRRGRARRRLRAAGRRRRRPRPGRAHQRDVGRAAALARPARARRARSSTSAGTATPRSRLSLGGAFHSRPPRHPRQPGRHASRRPAAGAARTADRLALALDLLRDPAFDALLTGQSRFDELPDVMARLAAGSLPALCHTITYDGG